MRTKSISSRLKDRVTLQASTKTPNGQGGYNQGWTTVVDDLPAEVVNASGREAIIAGALQGVSGWQVTIRYRTGVTVGHRLLFEGLSLNIQSCGPHPRYAKREALLLLCESGANG